MEQSPAPGSRSEGSRTNRLQMHFSPYSAQLRTHFRVCASKGFHFCKTKICTNFGLDADANRRAIHPNIYMQHVSVTQPDLQKLATIINQVMPTCTSHCATETKSSSPGAIWGNRGHPWHLMGREALWGLMMCGTAPHKGSWSLRLRNLT